MWTDKPYRTSITIKLAYQYMLAIIAIRRAFLLFWPMQKGPACGQQAGPGGHRRAPFAPVCPSWPTPTTRTPDLRLLCSPVPDTCPKSRKMPSYREWQKREARGVRRSFEPPQGWRTRQKASSMVYVKMGAIPISRFCAVHEKRYF